jgi:hypothetical protein
MLYVSLVPGAHPGNREKIVETSSFLPVRVRFAPLKRSCLRGTNGRTMPLRRIQTRSCRGHWMRFWRVWALDESRHLRLKAMRRSLSTPPELVVAVCFALERHARVFSQFEAAAASCIDSQVCIDFEKIDRGP